MNNTLFKDLSYKVFRSGNPLYFYIGVNTLIFLAVALTSVVFFLTGNAIELTAFVRAYLGLPAGISLLLERFYTPFTYFFFHEDFFHLLFNMLSLFWFGSIFLNFLKPRQFHFVYLAGGLAGALFYVACLNIFPAFVGGLAGATVIGSSAAVMAIIVATATLVPNYSLMLMFIGEVKIKYIALVIFIIDIIGTGSVNAGGSFAHIGGAVLGFCYIKSLQNGNDWSTFKLFKRKPKLKVVRNEEPAKKTTTQNVAQHEIDAILDKISSSGYDKLTKAEKDKLFNASKE
ncbi:rhomboid family intramembrane serine protease [Pedobacter sp. MW01-1-1]|uniref:rhomboid family intramembrane serine protease n=1 Tax=Pedobacter sp. MW01-1-1 TaxID=3383027 RepID=UPI003FEE0DC8